MHCNRCRDIFIYYTSARPCTLKITIRATTYSWSKAEGPENIVAAIIFASASNHLSFTHHIVHIT